MPNMTDFLDDQVTVAAWPPRDRYDRPLLPNAEGEIVPYTRASTMSGAIGNTWNIHKWQLNNLAKGIGDNEDLFLLLASLPPLETGDKKADKVTKKECRRIIELAWERQGTESKANRGTSMHAFVSGTQTGPVPSILKPRVHNYWQAMEEAKLTVLSREIFCANEELRAAGTFDVMARGNWADRRAMLREVPDISSFDGNVCATYSCIADLKSGDNFEPFEWACQLAVYAGAELVQRDFSRYPYPADFTADFGYVFHQTAAYGCVVWELDLKLGRQLALAAQWLRSLYADESQVAQRLVDLPVSE